ncbi:MAG: SAP domain-containing protein [Gammaproteobacteria bacterium]|nr:SAP domain-containing protein [Gammaproteobacteria bacterium]MCF6230524.1 SAP domain-containing protein [Gammaproteobacteria bacterium]
MKMPQVRKIAKQRGLTVGKLKKFELIRMIQSHEGNHPCYATDADGVCRERSCLWIDDCSGMAKKRVG